MYSQNDEEAHILNHLSHLKTGRLLDIGANDGRYLSNSLALIERGWSGVLVEANPMTFSKLVENHLGNPKLTLVNAAIGIEFRLTKFWHSTRDGLAVDPCAGLSTTEEKQRNSRSGGFLAPFYVPMVPLDELLSQFGQFDFLSIDTEGTSADLFTTFLCRGRERPAVICVEHDGRIGSCTSIANNYRYREVSRNAENLILVAEC
jgi:FkbM family methyltransferase